MTSTTNDTLQLTELVEVLFLLILSSKATQHDTGSNCRERNGLQPRRFLFTSRQDMVEVRADTTNLDDRPYQKGYLVILPTASQRKCVYHSAGAHTSVPLPTGVHVYGEPTLSRIKNSDCTRAAIENGIYAHNPKVAAHFLSLGPIAEKWFGVVNNWMSSNHLRYTLQYCNIGA